MVTRVANGHHMQSFESTLIGAFVLGMLFVFCWVTAAYGNLPVPGALVHLFTTLPIHSIAALYEGVIWALSIGAVSGALFALGRFLFHWRHQ